MHYAVCCGFCCISSVSMGPMNVCGKRMSPAATEEVVWEFVGRYRIDGYGRTLEMGRSIDVLWNEGAALCFVVISNLTLQESQHSIALRRRGEGERVSEEMGVGSHMHRQRGGCIE